MEKEILRMEKIEKVSVAALIITIIGALTLACMYLLKIDIPDALAAVIALIVCGGSLVLYIYCGSLKYIGKFLILPFTVMKGWGTLGLLIALAAFLFWFIIVYMVVLFLPGIILWYENRKCAEAIADAQ